MKESGTTSSQARDSFGDTIPWDQLPSVDFLLEGTNFTSRLPIDADDEPMRVVRISETGLWIDMPAQSCAVGHTLELRIFAQYRKNSPDLTEIEPMTVTAVVDSAERADEGGDPRRICVGVSFRQFAPEQWARLLGVFAEKQASLNRLIGSTRR